MPTLWKKRICLPALVFLAAHLRQLVAFSRSRTSKPSIQSASRQQSSFALASTFYNDFEEDLDGDDDNDDDDNDFSEMSDADVEKFRKNLGSLFGETEQTEKAEAAPTTTESSGDVDDLIKRTNALSSEESTDWALESREIKGGVVLVANPAKFCMDFAVPGDGGPSAQLLAKFGLTLPPPADLGPDRRADLLPVLCLLDHHALRGSHAVLLNRRTGYLLGDLEQQVTSEDGSQTSVAPKLGAFMIQPLWFGGTSASDQESSSGGLDMLHQCPGVIGAKALTEDGLFWGGDPAQAQDAMQSQETDRIYTGFDFKFFVQSTRWLPLQLEKEVRDGTWFVASVSKEVLFKPRDRMGTRRAKPLWTEIMELMGGEYQGVRDKLYAAS